MSKDIIVSQDNSQLALRQSKQLLGITKKILSHGLTVDESWMQRLWDWADANSIPGSDIPRDREWLLSLNELEILESDLTELPAEIGKLKKLEYLCIDSDVKLPPHLDPTQILIERV